MAVVLALFPTTHIHNYIVLVWLAVQRWHPDKRATAITVGDLRKTPFCLQEQAPTARRHNAVARHQPRPALVEQDTVEMSILNVKPSVTGRF